MSFQDETTKAQINDRFGPYCKPTEITIPRFNAIQEKTLELALLIDDLCPGSKEKETALTSLVNAKMSANAAISIHM